MAFDAWEVPADHWCVYTIDQSVFRVDEGEAQVVLRAIDHPEERWVFFADVFGSTCKVRIKTITSIYHSTPLSRERARKLNDALDSEGEPWK